MSDLPVTKTDDGSNFVSVKRWLASLVVMYVVTCLLYGPLAEAEQGWGESSAFALNLLTRRGDGTSYGFSDSASFSVILLGLRRSLGESTSFWHDGAVDIHYLRAFAAQWLEDGCLAALWCNGMDLDLSGEVDFLDFGFLASYWLE